MAILNVDFVDFQQHSLDYTRRCREQGDMLKLDYPGDINMYVVASHATVNEVLKNESGNFVHFADYFASQPKESETDHRIGEIFSRNLGNNSGMHLELRKDIRNHFNGKGVDQHNDFIAQTVSNMADNLERVAAENGGVVDLMEHFSKPLAFIVTSHVIGLEFKDREEQMKCAQLAGEAITLINLIAPEEVKKKALAAHDEFSEFIEPQLDKYINSKEEGLRTNCLLHDFAQKVREGESDKMESFLELINGLFQAGLGSTGSFLALCLELLLKGNKFDSPKDIQAYFLAPGRSSEEKNEAVNEYIRVSQQQLGGIFPRYSPEGGTVQGETIEPNSLVYMSLVSANMDENAFVEATRVNPDRVKIPKDITPEQLRERRENRLEKSMSFSYGEHMCPGRRISLVIIRYALAELFRRFPNMQLENIEVVGELFGRPSEVVSMNLRLNNQVTEAVA